VVVDYTGRPITAFPVSRYSGGALAAVAVSAAAATADAECPLDVYASLLAFERADEQERIDIACTPNDVAEFVIDLVLAPSCSAPDPHQIISEDEVNRRVRGIIGNLEETFGVTLDEETRANIRVDVIAIWEMGYHME